MGAIKGKEMRRVECPLCSQFSSKKLTTFEDHLKESHGTTAKELWDSTNGGPARCACGCGTETRWNGWWAGYSRVANGHNASIYSVCSPEEAAEISRKRSESLRGKTSWAKGLRKETDERIAARGAATSEGRKAAFDRKEIVSWNKGKTATTDERIAAAAENLKSAYAAGEIIPWAKGLSKDSDERIAAMASRVSLTMRQENIRRRLDAMKRLPVEEIRTRIEDLGTLKVVGGLEEYVNDAQKVIQVECSGCGEQFTGSLRSLQYGKCFKCSPGGSAAQEKLARWIEKMGVEVKRNDRSVLDNGLELDIHVKNLDFAVEYNGLYWHSHVNRSALYHSNKTTAAGRAGISMMHVFEDEWRDKSEIVKSMILSRIGMSPNKIGARKCSIRELSPQERKSFFEDNHIDGDTASSKSWGLVYDETIVYAISVRKPFHKKESTMEIARCCPKKGCNVQGGLSRLVKTVSDEYRKEGIRMLMTYVDTRLGGVGEGYASSGFKATSKTPPRFWWTDFKNRFNRFKYRADSKNGLTESDVAEAAGVVKIWGCENVVYEMNL
jgi:hypothetical protein